MSHSEVMKWFEYYFPDYAGERIDVFFPNGRNSIRIRQKNEGRKKVNSKNSTTVLRFFLF